MLTDDEVYVAMLSEALKDHYSTLLASGYAEVQLEHSSVFLIAHPVGECAEDVCSFHKRSDHHMRSWSQNWRGDVGLMERLCPAHGIGHPDPDDLKIVSGKEGWDVHGCCGCCSRPTQ